MKTPPGAQIETTSPNARFPRRFVLMAICVLLLLGVGAASSPFFLAWTQRHLIRQARVYLQLNNYPAFSRTLATVRQLNPDNVDACRLYAQAFLRRGDPAALPWLRLAVQLSNGRLDDQLALAEADLDFKRISEARKVLATIQGKLEGRAGYHDLAGRLAQEFGNTVEAEAHFVEAARLAPNDRLFQLRLATVRLDSADESVKKQAQNDLEELQVHPELSNMPLRALIADALKKKRMERAASLAGRLDVLPGRDFSDRLIYLDVLQQAGKPDFATRLAETQEEAARTPANILPFLAWMNAHGLSLIVKEWVQSLPLARIASTPIRIEIAHAYAITACWNELHTFIADDDWGVLDYMKNAFLARSLRGIGAKAATTRDAWIKALEEAGDHSEPLLALARMANEWGWREEFLEASWQAARHSEKALEATRSLGAYYLQMRDTAGLLRVYSLIVERNPENSDARNNMALFSLLLNKDAGGIAVGTARELHENEPANPAYASTYAFGLFRQGKTTQALGVMDALKPEMLRIPSVAVYYYAMLTVAGRHNEAQEYREFAKGADLLPEEEGLLHTVATGTTGQP